jgi:hypothetical protein
MRQKLVEVIEKMSVSASCVSKEDRGQTAMRTCAKLPGW